MRKYKNILRSYLRNADISALKKQGIPVDFLIKRTNVSESDLKNRNQALSDFKWPIFRNPRFD